MKTNKILALLAAGLLTIASINTASAQRNGGGQRQQQTTRSAAPQHSSRNGGGSQATRSGHDNGGGHSTAGHRSTTSRPQQEHRSAARPAQNHAPQHHAAAPAPQHHAPAHVHHEPAHVHHAPAHVHHAPAPVHHGSHVRVAGPVHHHHDRVFAPVRRYEHPRYHRHIDRRARVFYIDNTPYYSYGGTYYRYVNGYGYEEIYMPTDVIVEEVPYGARYTVVNNIGYYEADGMWLQPVDGGYLIVEKPVVSAAVVVPIPRPTFSFHASFGF